MHCVFATFGSTQVKRSEYFWLGCPLEQLCEAQSFSIKTLNRLILVSLFHLQYDIIPKMMSYWQCPLKVSLLLLAKAYLFDKTIKKVILAFDIFLNSETVRVVAVSEA